MKHADVVRTLNDVAKAWYNILPPGASVVADSFYFAGGCIPAMLIDQEVHDFDMYAWTRADLESFVDDILKANPPTIDGEPLWDTNQPPVFEFRTDGLFWRKSGKPVINAQNAMGDIVYNQRSIFFRDHKVQVVLPWYGRPDMVVEHFDFAHLQMYCSDHQSLQFYGTYPCLALATRELLYTGSDYPMASIVRVLKFLQRGFTINGGQMTRIVLDCIRHAPKTIEDLRSALNGIDLSTFFAMMNDLEQMGETDPMSERVSEAIWKRFF